MLLDLNLDSEAFIRCRTSLQENEVAEVNFSRFIEIYCHFCGMNDLPASRHVLRTGEEVHWVPNEKGYWNEVCIHSAPYDSVCLCVCIFSYLKLSQHVIALAGRR